MEAELLRYHKKFGHTSFKKLKIMARLGTILKKLEKFLVPTCYSCLYAKATKIIWRSRNSDNTDKARKHTKPRDCVSVDHLVSMTPGLVAQIIGLLTMNRYKHATIYVDQYSRLSFVYLQYTEMAKDILKVKEVFELYAK